MNTPSSERQLSEQETLATRLSDWLAEHTGKPVERIDTHISTLLLTDKLAYKLKKPVDFGFLDFTTLAKRQFCCEEELRLNQRLAPGLYQQVIPVFGSVEHPSLEGDGEPIDYLVQMARFAHDQELDQLIMADQLDDTLIDELADTIAGFHQQIPAAAADDTHAQPANIGAAVQQNFDQIRPLHEKLDDELIITLNALESWSQTHFQRLEGVMQQRLADGRVRECHGDMHLGNITRFAGKVTIFDGIEFNPAFRWIDVISEMAFLLMDLQRHGRDKQAFRLLNRYLEQTGDYAGIQLLGFYQVYRAMVRAKVTALGLLGMTEDEDGFTDNLASFTQYVTLADRLSDRKCRFLAITHGVSGSGKSYCSQQLLEAFQAVRIRSDVERLRLFATRQERYTAAASETTYNRLLAFGQLALKAGFSVILDATYLEQRQREVVQVAALQQHCPYLVLAMQADEAILKQRIIHRNQNLQDASEADVDVMQRQLEHLQPLTDEELPHCLAIVDADLAVSQVNDWLSV